MNAKFERGDQDKTESMADIDSGSSPDAKYVYCARYGNFLYVSHNAMS